MFLHISSERRTGGGSIDIQFHPAATLTIITMTHTRVLLEKLITKYQINASYFM
jgi:hypothetical protein